MLCNRILQLFGLPTDFIHSGNYMGRDRRQVQVPLPGADRRLEPKYYHHTKSSEEITLRDSPDN